MKTVAFLYDTNIHTRMYEQRTYESLVISELVRPRCNQNKVEWSK